MEAVNTKNLKFAPDVGQLQKGGADAAKVVKDFLPLVKHMHLKDYKGWQWYSGYCPLGMGTVDIPTILDMVEGVGLNPDVMVELDPFPDGPMTSAPDRARRPRHTSKSWDISSGPNQSAGDRAHGHKTQSVVGCSPRLSPGCLTLVVVIRPHTDFCPDAAANPILPGATMADHQTPWAIRPLKQINKNNVTRLKLVWFVPAPGPAGRFSFNPLVIDGVMYVVGKDDGIYALDAATGKQIWAIRSKEDSPPIAASTTGHQRTAKTSG